MPWKYNGRTLKIGRGWTDDNGTQHPYNWGNWSPEHKASLGLVWEDDPVEQPYDKRFYYAYNLPKPLDDQPQVDEDGNPVLDMEGNQVVTGGLKTAHIAKTKATAASLLSDTDWYVVRYTETTTAIPTTVSDYRAAIRTASNAIEAAIANAADHAAFVALFDTPVDADGVPTGNAPIHDWPVDPKADPSMP